MENLTPGRTTKKQVYFILALTPDTGEKKTVRMFLKQPFQGYQKL